MNWNTNRSLLSNTRGAFPALIEENNPQASTFPIPETIESSGLWLFQHIGTKSATVSISREKPESRAFSFATYENTSYTKNTRPARVQCRYATIGSITTAAPEKPTLLLETKWPRHSLVRSYNLIQPPQRQHIGSREKGSPSVPCFALIYLSFLSITFRYNFLRLMYMWE